MARPLLNFFKKESAGGICLLLAAVLATVLENSPLRQSYRELWQYKITLGVGHFSLSKPLILWVDDLLMTLFFFLVGLELKREAIEGELRSVKRVMLPAIAALGGMIFPAVVFFLINLNDPLHHQGWAIPAATDIAFSLAVLSVLGKRVPHSLRIFLTSLAIFDDLGAILIIALFYSAHLSIQFLLLAAGIYILLLLLNKREVKTIFPYAILGIFLWLFTLKSGIHATISGVLLALTIPTKPCDQEESPLKRIEHAIHPWVAFFVLPIFAFANGGLNLETLKFSSLGNSLTLGVLCGLFFGKQLGVFATSWIAIRLRWAELPTKCNWIMLYGVSIITGIGFTMSLFIGGLAFTDHHLIELAKTGTIVGSLLSAVFGFIILRFYSRTMTK